MHKNDSWDAECVARALRNDWHRLPDFLPDEHDWGRRQLVTRRRGLSRHLSAVVRQLHGQLGYLCPSYRSYFSETDGKTALAFWRRFPSLRCLEGITAETLAAFLRKASNYACSTRKAEHILHCVREDGNTDFRYAEEKELVIVSPVKQIRGYQRELARFDERLRDMLARTGCQLHTLTGVDVVTAAELAAEIGDIAPISAESGGKGRYTKSKQGDRSLYDIFKALAIRQIVVGHNTKALRNPAFHAYYLRKMAEGKTKKQALICIMRRLVNIVYSILKHKEPYRLPKPGEDR